MSVFAPWKEDTKQSILNCFKEDWDHTKISKLIKNEDDLAATKKYLESNYEFIKECYLDLQYNSVYPFVNKIALSQFCEKC